MRLLPEFNGEVGVGMEILLLVSFIVGLEIQQKNKEKTTLLLFFTWLKMCWK
jgi:hypothetical protein